MRGEEEKTERRRHKEDVELTRSSRRERMGWDSSRKKSARRLHIWHDDRRCWWTHVMWCRWHCRIHSWYPRGERWRLFPRVAGYSPATPPWKPSMDGWDFYMWIFFHPHTANHLPLELYLLSQSKHYYFTWAEYITPPPPPSMWILHCTESKEGDRLKGTSPTEDPLIAPAKITQKS